MLNAAQTGVMDIRIILCPVDFSETSQAALHAAACFARQFDAEVRVAFVQDPLLAAAARQSDDEIEAELKAFVDATGEDVLRHARMLVVTGKDVAARVVMLATHEQADLIVMGSHGLTGVRKAFFGSTTARVLKTSTGPLLIVPQAAAGDRSCDLEGLGPVLVLTDFREAAAYAAMAAAHLAKAVDAPFVLVHVLPHLPMPLSWADKAVALTPQRMDDAHAEMAHAIVPIETITPVESTILQGNIATAVADLARKRHAGLIVMGLSAGMTGPQPGATAYPVICGAPVPVLVVPAPRD
jgi:nucleotide-binding universal stress UspA family protein